MTNLPLSLGIGVDTSGSMEESIVEAQKAAVEFLKDVMTKRDRSFLVTFDNEPQLVSRFTTDRDQLAQALAGLRAQGSTALWDALVYGLYQYQGTKGRKAYVILTDGEDRCSHFTFEAALDYAKKTGVAVYFIGLRIGSTQLDVRHKLGRVARETGGIVYYVESARGLARIYAEIDEELRSQYLLSYVPQNKSVSNQWRKIEVKMTPSNLTARTISGYYPCSGAAAQQAAQHPDRARHHHRHRGRDLRRRDRQGRPGARRAAAQRTWATTSSGSRPAAGR